MTLEAARPEKKVTVRITNPDKLLFPADGISKGDVVDYYRHAAPRLLPHIIDRPLTLERYPAGIEKAGFMQKNAAGSFPSYIGRVELPKQDGTVRYPTVSDVDGLVYLANQNTITFHIASFRADNIGLPDRLVFDLDPVEGDAAGGRLGARRVAALLTELDITSMPMTTGSKGYHVVVPLLPTVGFEAIARFSQAVAYVVALRPPERLTVEFLKRERRGRVFIDWLRNHFGATSVAPYSLRPKPGAPIAMPITWDEFENADPADFRLPHAVSRLEFDPWADVPVVDLAPAVAALDRQLEDGGFELPAFDRFGR